ncbi:MAG: metalloregulator ArsR/SmtB family transcription factor [Lacisediminihabitans sp.]
MNALDILGDPVRRRLVELLAAGDRAAGEVSDVVEAEFGISQPAVARHLRVLREAGFVTSTPRGARRIYALQPLVIDQLQQQVDRYRALWNQRLDALETEIARGTSRAATKGTST